MTKCETCGVERRNYVIREWWSLWLKCKYTQLIERRNFEALAEARIYAKKIIGDSKVLAIVPHTQLEFYEGEGL